MTNEQQPSATPRPSPSPSQSGSRSSSPPVVRVAAMGVAAFGMWLASKQGDAEWMYRLISITVICVGATAPAPVTDRLLGFIGRLIPGGRSSEPPR